ncbi:MAG: HesB/IscA family protein, partial [Hyphomonadaceae bacterium]
AASRIRALTGADPSVTGLRIAVEGGGCSGFQYDIQLTASPAEDDIVIDNAGAVVYLDPISVPFIEGSVLDWAEELIGASFKVQNPNAKSACGCGVSFSI